MLHPKDPEITIDHYPDKVVITYKCNTELASLPWLGIFAFVAFNAVPLLMLCTVDGNGDPISLHRLVPIWIIVNVFGVPCLYFGLQAFLTKGTLTARPDSIKLRVRPFPYGPDRTYDVRGVKQFFGRRLFGDAGTGLGKSFMYLTAEDYLESIPAHLPTEHGAMQVVRELQEFYGLEDLPVYGYTSLDLRDWD